MNAQEMLTAYAAENVVTMEFDGSGFCRLLAANCYRKDTLGATLSWHDELEQVVLA